MKKLNLIINGCDECPYQISRWGKHGDHYCDKSNRELLFKDDEDTCGLDRKTETPDWCELEEAE